MTFADFQRWVTAQFTLTNEAKQYLDKLERENAALRADLAALTLRVEALE